MKIHMDVDCTPDEARTLFGLPDVKPMQKAMMAEVETRMKKALTAMEPDALLKMWLPAERPELRAVAEVHLVADDRRQAACRHETATKARRRDVSVDVPPPYYRCHVFCCVNERPTGHQRGSCSRRGSVRLRNYMKARAKELGLADVRINASGCLDRCELGPTMVIYPDGVWYHYETLADVDEILERSRHRRRARANG